MVFQFSPHYAFDPDKVVAIKKDKDDSVVLYFDNGLELKVSDGYDVKDFCDFIEEVKSAEKK